MNIMNVSYHLSTNYKSEAFIWKLNNLPQSMNSLMIQFMSMDGGKKFKLIKAISLFGKNVSTILKNDKLT